MNKKSLAVVATVSMAALLFSGCSGGPGGGGDGETIKIGTSLPLTGALSSFGPLLQEGYQAAIDAVNEDGGLDVGGTKRKVELVVLDSASDPTTVSDQNRTLVLQDGVTALLGSLSPGLVIPASNTADLEKIPLVSTLTPLQSWKAGNSAGWNYAWTIGFDEGQLTDVPFHTADTVDTDKKIALFTDNEEDGIAMGALWESKAPTMGYEIAYHAKFPVGTTEYSEYINQAKASGADIVIAQMIPPDAFALWKQMKALAFVPKVAFCEKCSSQAAFQRELGPLAEGTSVSTIFQQSGTPAVDALTKKFQPKYGNTLDLTTVIAAYSATQVLLDAITAAGSTDATAINDALAKTNGDYPIGKVSFDGDNVCALPPIALQWQGDEQVQVFPVTGGTQLEVPVSGLG